MVEGNVKRKGATRTPFGSLDSLSIALKCVRVCVCFLLLSISFVPGTFGVSFAIVPAIHKRSSTSTQLLRHFPNLFLNSLGDHRTRTTALPTTALSLVVALSQ